MSVPTYNVVLTQDAELDLEDIYDYITVHDSPSNVDYMLEQLLKQQRVSLIFLKR